MTRAVVVYESMYGNSRAVAEAIAKGLSGQVATDLHAVSAVQPADLAGADLLVVGGPTHAWGLSRPSSRRSAADAARKPGSVLTLEPDAEGAGLREWLADLPDEAMPRTCACFDTRLKAPLGLSGSAGRAIARRLRKHGTRILAPVEGFVVGRDNRLLDGERERATAWGQRLGADLSR